MRTARLSQEFRMELQSDVSRGTESRRGTTSPPQVVLVQVSVHLSGGTDSSKIRSVM